MVYLNDRKYNSSSSGLSSCTTFARTALARLDRNEFDFSLSGLIQARQASLARHEYELARIDSKMRKVERRERQLENAKVNNVTIPNHGSTKLKMYRRGASPFFSAEKPLYTILAERKPTIIKAQHGTKQGIHSSHASIVNTLPKELSPERKASNDSRKASARMVQEQKSSSEARRQLRVARFSEYLTEAIERKIDAVMQTKLNQCQCPAVVDVAPVCSEPRGAATIPEQEPALKDVAQEVVLEESQVALPELAESSSAEGSQQEPKVEEIVPVRTSQNTGVQVAKEVRESATQTRYSSFPAAGLEQSLPLVVKRYKHRSPCIDSSTPVSSLQSAPGILGERGRNDSTPSLDSLPVDRPRHRQMPASRYAEDWKTSQTRGQRPRPLHAAPQGRPGVILRPSPLCQDSTEQLAEPTVIELSRTKHRSRRNQHESSVSLGLRMENCGAFDGKRQRVHRIGLKSKQARGRLRLWLFGV